MSSVKIYFVLYIMILCELFLVIIARDEAQDAWWQFMQTQSTKLEFANVKGDNFLVIPNLKLNQITWQYNLYPKGFISQEEKDSDSVYVEIGNDKFTNGSNSILNWDKNILKVNKFKPIDTIFDRNSKTKIRLFWDSTGLVYKIFIDLDTKDQLQFVNHKAIYKPGENSYVILPLRAYFTTTGNLPFQKHEEIKNIVINSIERESEKGNMKELKRVIKNDEVTSDTLQIYIRPGFFGVDPRWKK
ncbi:MAG: hypothetical protein ABSA76_11740 [Bacteroidales bacterium]